MSQPEQQKRKSYLIIPSFQWKVIAYAAILAAVVILTFYLAQNYFIYSLRSMGAEVGLDDQHPFYFFINEQARILNYIFIALAIAVNVIVIFGGLWLSNRIAGPIYRIQTSLQQILSQEKAEKIAFRKDDFFSDLVSLINQLIDKTQNEEK